MSYTTGELKRVKAAEGNWDINLQPDNLPVVAVLVGHVVNIFSGNGTVWKKDLRENAPIDAEGVLQFTEIERNQLPKIINPPLTGGLYADKIFLFRTDRLELFAKYDIVTEIHDTPDMLSNKEATGAYYDLRLGGFGEDGVHGEFFFFAGYPRGCREFSREELERVHPVGDGSLSPPHIGSVIVYRDTDNSWHVLEAKYGRGPVCRVKYALSFKNWRLYVCGGQGLDGELLNDLWITERFGRFHSSFNVSTCRWSQVKMSRCGDKTQRTSHASQRETFAFRRVGVWRRSYRLTC